METELKVTLGKIMGEIYRLQAAKGISTKTEGHIYGLLNGIEEAIDNEFDITLISKSNIKKVEKLLRLYFNGEKSLSFFNSESARLEMEHEGVSHEEYTKIIEYLKAHGHYKDLFDKLK